MRPIMRIAFTVAVCLFAITGGGPAAAARLRWLSGKGQETVAPVPGAQCTLIVERSIEGAEGVRILWAGNGHLSIKPFILSAPEPKYDASRSPSEAELAAAASGEVTTHANIDATGTYIATIVSGDAFSIAAYEFYANRSLEYPMQWLPVITLNDGAAPPFRPVPMAAEVSVQAESTTFLVRGLGLSLATDVRYLTNGVPGGPVPFAAFGDTQIRVRLATQTAALVAGFQVLDVLGAGGRAASLRSGDEFRGVLPQQLLVELVTDLDAEGLMEIGGIREIIRLGPSTVTVKNPGTSPFEEEVSRYRVLTLQVGIDAQGALATLRKSKIVARAELVGPGPYPSADPNDLLWNEQWALHQVATSFCDGLLVPAPNSSINMPQAWQLPSYAPDFKIGIIDAGYANFSLDASQFDPLVPPVSYAPNDPSIDDDSNTVFHHHGAAVTSIAAAVTDNGHGLAGPASKLIVQEPPFTVGMPVSIKWWGNSGGGWPSIAACINHVYQEPSGRIRIANLSLSGSEPSSFERQALVRSIKNAFLHGKLLVAAAGNTNDSDRTYPAAFDDFVLGVGATLWNNKYWTNVNASPFVPLTDSAEGSKWGSWVDLVAPGGLGITAARNFSETPPNILNSYYTLQNTDAVSACRLTNLQTVGFSGTSASAPFVSGVAAWLLRMRPSLSSEDAGQVILRTCQDMGAPGWDVRFGNGRLNAAAAAAFISYPNWISHMSAGGGGQAPLVAQSDSVPVSLQLLNASGISSGTHSCIRYRLRGVVSVSAGFLQTPAVWVRRAETIGIANVAYWDDDERAPWAEVISATPSEVTVETYVYRVTDAGNRWYPSPPADAQIAITAVGPSGTLDVSGQPAQADLAVRYSPRLVGRGLKFDVSGLLPGPFKVELFDVTGRKVGSVSQGTCRGETLSFDWDGRGASGKILAQGAYIVRVTQPSRDAAKLFIWLR